jgi:PIN domain nuclease of toxin-antitoxin system
MIRYVLDTHAFVWMALDNDKLSVRARRVIANAPIGSLGVPAALIIELGYLIHLDKIEWEGRLNDLYEKISSCTILSPTLSAAIRAPALALPHADPHDRSIVACALDLGVPLITKDGNITDSGIVETIW